MELNYDDSAIWPQAADGNGATLQLKDDSTTLGDQLSKYYSWESSLEYGGSPAAAGAEKIGIVINEVLANTDPPSELTDSIELRNTSDQSIDISGWYLSDAAGNLTKFQIPANTVLGPGQYSVFNEAQFNADPDNGFALSGYNGDDIYLTIADAQGKPQSIVADVHFGPSLNGEPFGRDAHGWLTPLEALTLGSENAAPRVGPVIISEVQYDPDEPTAADLAIDSTFTSGDLEFVEIYNPTTQPVSLLDWRIRGGIDYNFLPDASVDPGSALVVIRFNPGSPANATRLAAFRNHYGLDESTSIVGGYSQQLSGTGERVTLLRPICRSRTRSCDRWCRKMKSFTTIGSLGPMTPMGRARACSGNRWRFTETMGRHGVLWRPRRGEPRLRISRATSTVTGKSTWSTLR